MKSLISAFLIILISQAFLMQTAPISHSNSKQTKKADFNEMNSCILSCSECYSDELENPETNVNFR